MLKQNEKIGFRLGINGVFGNMGVAFAPLIIGLILLFDDWHMGFLLSGLFCLGYGLVFVANLKPRKLRGVMSEGMMLAADDGNGSVRLITLDGDITPGSQVR